MLKGFALLTKRDDITDERFGAHWKHPHGTLAARITSLRGYSQNHRLRDGAVPITDAHWDGIANPYLPDVAAARAMLADPEPAQVEAEADQPNFMDVDRLAFVFTRSERLRSSGPAMPVDGEVKVICLWKGHDGAAVGERWRPEGIDDALDALGAHRVWVSTAVAELAPVDERAYDAFLELWWPDTEAMVRGLRDEAAWDAVRAPAGIDDGRSAVFAAREHVVVPVRDA